MAKPRPVPLLVMLGGIACHHAARPESRAEPEVVAAPAAAIGGPADTVALQDVIAEGRRIFHGPGLCYACHGGRLQGGPVAPPLAGPGRSMNDTSFAFVLHTIRAGSPHTPMVARQGAISDGEVLQVANYVWAVSNGKSVP